MNVVTCYRAAKIANVKKQTISEMKQKNALGTGKYDFFCYHPKTGEFGVDVDSPAWSGYIDRRRSRNLLDENETEHGLTTCEQPKRVDDKALLLAVKRAVKERCGMAGRDLNELLKYINELYTEAINV